MTEIIPVVLALFGVIALMLGVLYLMKWLNTRISGGRDRKGIKVTSCIGVGQDKSLMTVRAGKKNLLIGVTQGGINLICELSDEDMEMIDSTSHDGQSTDGISFSDCLKKNIAGFGKELITPKPSAPPEDEDKFGNDR